MKALRIIKTGEDTGPTEVRSVVVDRILSEISLLYFARAAALQSGDYTTYEAANVRIAGLKNALAKL